MKFILFRFLTLIFALFLFACSSNTNSADQLTLIPGGKMYGGVLKFMTDEAVTNLFPMGVNDKYSLRVTTQIYEGLLKMDGASLKIKPALAEKFEVNEAGDVYTFTIRKDIFFHENECFKNKTRELTAEDVKFSLDFLCSGDKMVHTDHTFIDLVKGAKTYFSAVNKPKTGVEGIVVKGNKVSITLNQPFIGFESIVCKNNIAIFPKEALQKYGKKLSENPVGTGPFKLKSMDKNLIALSRNEKYWRKDNFGTQLPYLAQINIINQRDKKAEMLAFRNREIDLITDFGIHEIENVLGTLQEAKDGKNIKHRIETSTVLGMEFLAFNQSIAPFNNPLVRKAFALAIDVEQLVTHALDGDGLVPENGFVPFMEGFDNTSLPYSVDILTAQRLLTEAGFNAKNPFPQTSIYVNGVVGSLNYAVVKEIVSQLNRNLGIRLDVKSVTFTERIEAISSGKAMIWKAGVVADFPSPFDFLMHFYSKDKYVNQFGYKSDSFNNLLWNAVTELNISKRNEFIRQAQDVLAADYSIVPLLRDDMIIMVNVKVRGVKASQTEIIDFSEVFIKEIKD